MPHALTHTHTAFRDWMNLWLFLYRQHFSVSTHRVKLSYPVMWIQSLKYRPQSTCIQNWSITFSVYFSLLFDWIIVNIFRITFCAYFDVRAIFVLRAHFPSTRCIVYQSNQSVWFSTSVLMVLVDVIMYPLNTHTYLHIHFLQNILIYWGWHLLRFIT